MKELQCMIVLDVQYIFAGLDLLDLHMFVLQCIYGVYRKQGRRGDTVSPATIPYFSNT